MATESEPPLTGEIHIDMANLGSITVYQITEDELELIEQGSPNSNHLNFSIALLSVFISFLITLLTTTIDDNRTFIFFLVVAIVTSVLGFHFLIQWLRTRKSSNKIFTKIRARKNSDQIREAVEAQNVAHDGDELTESDPNI